MAYKPKWPTLQKEADTPKETIRRHLLVLQAKADSDLCRAQSV
jgi:hypothetical protein